MNILTILHIILSISIIALIFIQPSSGGLGSSNILSSSAPTRRGWDKITFSFTVITLFVFLVSALVQAIL